MVKEVQKKRQRKKQNEDGTNIPRMTLRGNKRRSNVTQISKENATNTKSTTKGKYCRKKLKKEEENIPQKKENNKKKSVTKGEKNSTKENTSTREDKKEKGVPMKDSGLKLLAEAAVLHPIETEVPKIQDTPDSTPNVNLKLGIDNAPKKRVLQLWKCKPVEIENSENEKDGKMIVKYSNAESRQMTVGKLHDSKDMTDNGRKLDAADPVAMASSLTENGYVDK